MVSGISYRVVPCIRAVLAAGCLVVLAVCLPLQAAQSPNTADEFYDQGVQSLKQEQWKTAISRFEEALKLDPRRAPAENGLGVAFGKLGDRDASVAAFRRAIAIDSNSAEAHYNLGLWLQESGDLDQAIS